MADQAVIPVFRNTYEEVLQYIQTFEAQNHVYFTCSNGHRGFNRDNIKNIANAENPMTIRWKDPQPNSQPFLPDDGYPFYICGRKRLVCHHGPDKHLGNKAAKIDEEHGADHNVQRRRRIQKPSKKVACTAIISIRHIIRFPEFQIPPEEPSMRKSTAKLIKTRIDNGEDVYHEHRFYIQLPSADDHQNHITGPAAGLCLPMANSLKERARQLVQQGVVETHQVREHLQLMVLNKLFKDQEPPPRTNAQYWPSHVTISNLIYNNIYSQRFQPKETSPLNKKSQSTKRLSSEHLIAKEATVGGPPPPTPAEDITAALNIQNTMPSVIADNGYYTIQESVIKGSEADNETPKSSAAVSLYEEVIIESIPEEAVAMFDVEDVDNTAIEDKNSVSLSEPSLAMNNPTTEPHGDIHGSRSVITNLKRTNLKRLPCKRRKRTSMICSAHPAKDQRLMELNPTSAAVVQAANLESETNMLLGNKPPTQQQANTHLISHDSKKQEEINLKIQHKVLLTKKRYAEIKIEILQKKAKRESQLLEQKYELEMQVLAKESKLLDIKTTYYSNMLNKLKE